MTDWSLRSAFLGGWICFALEISPFSFRLVSAQRTFTYPLPPPTATEPECLWVRRGGGAPCWNQAFQPVAFFPQVLVHVDHVNIKGAIYSGRWPIHLDFHPSLPWPQCSYTWALLSHTQKTKRIHQHRALQTPTGCTGLFFLIPETSTKDNSSYFSSSSKSHCSLSAYYVLGVTCTFFK